MIFSSLHCEIIKIENLLVNGINKRGKTHFIKLVKIFFLCILFRILFHYGFDEIINIQSNTKKVGVYFNDFQN